MGHRHDYTALDWVHKELGETLNQAQLALAAFEDDNSDVTRLQFCLNYLHQVRGTLDMVEVYGAALLASELEKLAAFLVSRPERANNDRLSVLLQGILQLPTYLERLMRGDSDQPLILAPLLNDLRAQRDASSLAVARLFAPDLRHEQARLAEPFLLEQMPDDQLPHLQKLHQLYQLSLLNLLRGHEPAEALNYLCKSTHRIATEYGDCGLGMFWSIATTLLDALRQNKLALSQDLLRLLSQLDRVWRQQLRALKRHQTPQIDHSALTTMLYFVGQASADHPGVASLQERFVLSEALLSEQQVSSRRQQMQGPDTHTVDSVARVLVDELATVKEQLDLLVRASDRQPTQLQPLIAPLQQISDTMDLLQIKQARRVLDEQIQHLDNLSHQTSLDDESLMDIAGGLLYVEATLSGLAQSGMDDEQFDSMGNELSNAHIALIREVRNSIETCKEAIVAYLGTQWDIEKLRDVPAELHQIQANLNIIPLYNAAVVADGLQTYVESELLVPNHAPEWQDMDRLADALVGIDYYLERLPRDRGEDGNDAILQRAADSLAALGYPVNLSNGQQDTPPPEDAVNQALDDYFGFIDQLDEAGIDAAIAASDEPHDEASAEPNVTASIEDSADKVVKEAPEVATDSEWPEYRAMDLDALDSKREGDLDLPPAPQDEAEEADEPSEAAAPEVEATAANDDDDLIDDDIREIFLEEADDVQAEIAQWFPAYCADPDNKEALGELRRAFHTLKGSGRMVRAMVIGELGWSIENMLNHRRDGVIPHSDALVSLIEDVNAMLPQLVSDFAQNTPSDTKAVDQLRDRASAIIAGEHDVIEPFDDGLDAYVEDDSEFEEAAETTESAPAAVEMSDDKTSDEAPSDTDQARLFAIFSHEIHNHLTTIEEFLHASAGDPTANVTDSLQRALHTIKGSSHMAGIEAMANLAGPVEQLIKSLQVYRLPATPAVQQLLQDTVAIASDQLNSASDQTAIVPAPDSFFDQLKDLNAWVADSAAAAGSESSSSLMSIFLNEAMNTVLDAEDTLKAWQESGLESHRVTALQRDLTTLADAARAIDLLPLSSLANQLVVLYEYLAEQPPTDANDPVFSSLYEAHEAVIDMMDRLAAGQSIQTRHDIESELAELAGAPLAGPAEKPQEAPESNSGTATASTPSLTDSATPVTEEWFSLKSMDADILDVFLEEANELLESIQRELETWRDAPDNLKPVADLQRDLHTLKGGARMSEATPVGDLAHELEFLYEGLCNGQLTPSDDLMSLIMQGQDKLSDMVHDIIENQGCYAAPALINAIYRARQGLPPELPVQEDPRGDLSAARARIVAESDDEPLLSFDELETLDSDILEVFVDEAVELLSELDEAIAQWHEDPTNELAADEMKRVLHTLKGGSRLARLPSMGVLSHELESFIVRAQEQRAPLDDAFFAHLLQQYDQLSVAVEQLQQIASSDGPQVAEPDDSAAPKAPGNVVPFQHRPQPDEAAETPDVPAPRNANAGTHKGSAGAATAARRAPQETVKVSASLLENLVNLAGETSISRARLEEQVSDMGFTLGELDTTIERLRDKVRQLDMETEAQVLFRQERAEESNYEDFDPLEMDRYTQIQQLSRSLMETASDLIDLRSTLANKSRDAETVLLQQSRIHSELQEGLMQTRMVPFSRLVPRLRRIVRQVATELGKDARFDVLNAEGEMDRSVLERMVSPLEHMLRNAVDHGIETMAAREEVGKPNQGHIVLSLAREGGDVVLKLQDDGHGIDVQSVRRKAIERGLMSADSDMPEDEILQFILSSGFSTAQKVTQISGRGVGMDVVHNEVKALGGTMEISTEQGQGTTFLIRLPFTVSVNRALMVASGDDIYAIPLNTIDGIVRMQPAELRNYLEHPDKHYPYGDKQYVIKPLGQLLRNEHEVHSDEIALPQPIILIKGGDRNESVALHIDRLMGSREIVVKTLGPQFATVPAVSGATILGDGSVVVILDVPAMLRTSLSTLVHHADDNNVPKNVTALPVRKRDLDTTINVMVVDDSVTVRKVTSRLLTRNGMEVITAKDGADAMLLLQDHVPDIILLDIEMPRMDGFEVANRVRHTERLQSIPIIMITSRTGQKHKDRALEIGVNDYMGKPFQESQLLDAIQRLVLN
ncbi:Hpt domain-containing protein [Salinispirillum sp. LH 10-3-1]|uniref:Chemotaxis protein CheA n=1 Tax=Salinispirillum sp. LH 10-3-1 TaxID=2952525 RepID=A0AB38YGK7_9GAMM